MAQPLLDLFDPKTKEFITKQEIRDALKNLLRTRLEEYKDKIEEHEDKLDEIIEKSGGKFAQDYINKIASIYEEKQLLIEAEPDNKEHRISNPFDEMNHILNDFFTNDSLNNELTLVTGEDLCKVFDICLFLAE